MTDSQQTSKRSRRRFRTRTRGQGLVEFALIMPILVFMLLITVDFARAYSAYIQVTNAARAGAIYGSRSSTFANDSSAVANAALLDSPSIYGSAPSVSSSTSMDGDNYEQVTVTVNYSFSPLFNYPGIPSNVLISRTVTMRIV